MPISIRHRFLWGILFALLGTASIWAMSQIPYTDPIHWFSCALNDGGESLNVEHDWYGTRKRDDQFWGWIMHFDFDLTTGAMDPWSQPQSIRQMMLFSRPPRRKVDERMLKSFQYSTVRQALSYVSDGSGFALVADRYVVGQSSGKIRSVDLGDPQLTRREIDASSQSGCPYQIPGSRNFVLEPAGALLGANISKTPIRLDLIRINDDGNFELLANWETHWSSSVGIKSSVAVGDQIASLNGSGTAIEFRSIDDAQLLDTLELPMSFDANRHPWHFDWNLFCKNRGNLEGLVIDLQSKQELPLSPNAAYQLRPFEDSNSPLLNYVHIQLHRGVLIDRKTGQRIMEYDYDDRASPIVLDEHRLLFPSRDYGFSANIVEIPSGKQIRSLVPLWWVPWFVGLSLLTFLIAAIGWMRASVLDGGWALVDVALVGGLALLLLSLRLRVGESFDSNRTPHLLINGICTAAVMLAGIWLVLGKSPWILRCLPLLLAFSFVVAVRYGLWGDRPNLVWHSTMPIVISLGITLLICFVARLFRIEFARQLPAHGVRTDDNATQRHASAIRLRDLLLMIACIGVLLAMMRPLLPTFSSIRDLAWWESRTVYATCAMLLLGAAMMSSRSWIFGSATSIAFVMAAALVASELSSFVGSPRLPWYHLIPLGYTASAGISSIALFLVPYRLRGWRIRRQEPTA